MCKKGSAECWHIINTVLWNTRAIEDLYEDKYWILNGKRCLETFEAIDIQKIIPESNFEEYREVQLRGSTVISKFWE